MYIRCLEFKDVRAIRSVELNLQRPDGSYAGWTVIAGRNGAGKSTFLKALALSLAGPAATRGLQRSFAGWIREGQAGAVAALEVVIDEVDRFGGDEHKDSGQSLLMGLSWTRMEHGLEPALAAVGEGYDPNRPRVQEEADGGPWAPNPQGWFIVGYGPYRRLSSHGVDVQGLMMGPPQVARLVNLFREDASLIEGIQWLKELHVRRLEKREGAEELLEGVLNLLNDGLLPDGTRVTGFDSEGLWLEQGGVRLPLRDMSDGYRTMAALVLDMARQLHATYREFKLSRQNGRWCVPYPGVVLIDEVEQHLHLTWQRRIGFWLKQHFPRIQFIVATHSPFVCQAADPKGLIRLPAPGEERSAEHVSDELYKTVVNGSVDEAALTELFGLERVHSDESERLRERVAELEASIMEGQATPEVREELERLAAQLPSTGSALVDRAVRKFGLDK